MKTISYSIVSLHYLKYFIPLIERLNKYKHIMYYHKISKIHQCPFKNLSFLKNISKKYNFELKYKNDFKNEKTILFVIEGEPPVIHSNRKYKIISLNYCTDFFVLAPTYINYIDYTINTFNDNFIDICCKNIKNNFIWKKYLSIHNSQIIKEKQKFFVNPKYYNVKFFNKENIINKYKLINEKKYIFFFLPQKENLLPLKKIFTFFIKKKYILLLKIRNKHEYSNNFQNFCNENKSIYYFNDTKNYYPSITLELIYISSFKFIRP